METDKPPIPKRIYKPVSFSFVSKTVIFAIVGCFIPGFTAIALLELQTFLSRLGIECASAWRIICIGMTLGAIVLPCFFIKYFRKQDFSKTNMTLFLMLFNILEYLFIQASLIPFFTSGHTLCYARDGQNGLELVFTAILSLPVLLTLSWLFDILHKKHLQQALIQSAEVE